MGRVIETVSIEDVFPLEDEYGNSMARRDYTLKANKDYVKRLAESFNPVLALPQNQPNAPLYPAGGAPGSRPGALPHFGRPRYLGPPPRARSTAG